MTAKCIPRSADWLPRILVVMAVWQSWGTMWLHAGHFERALEKAILRQFQKSQCRFVVRSAVGSRRADRRPRPPLSHRTATRPADRQTSRPPWVGRRREQLFRRSMGTPCNHLSRHSRHAPSRPTTAHRGPSWSRSGRSRPVYERLSIRRPRPRTRRTGRPSDDPQTTMRLPWRTLLAGRSTAKADLTWKYKLHCNSWTRQSASLLRPSSCRRHYYASNRKSPVWA